MAGPAEPPPLEDDGPDWNRINARRFTKRLPERRWELAKEFAAWYEAQLFPGDVKAMCEVWMQDRFPKAAPVDLALLRYACLRHEDGTWRTFRRKEA